MDNGLAWSGTVAQEKVWVKCDSSDVAKLLRPCGRLLLSLSEILCSGKWIELTIAAPSR